MNDGVWLIPHNMILLLQNSKNASTRLSMNGKAHTFSISLPFVLRFSKDERKVFRQNHRRVRFVAPRASRFRGPRIIALIAALLPLSPVSIFAQSLPPAKLQKVTALYGARSGASWPMWMAKDGGYYRRQGLDVELVFGVHPAPIAAVISGQAVMTPAGADPALLSASKDPSLVLLGSYLNKGSFALVAAKNINQINQLAGKRIGVGRVGDPPYHFTLSLLRKHGINPKEVRGCRWEWMQPRGLRAFIRVRLTRHWSGAFVFQARLLDFRCSRCSPITTIFTFLLITFFAGILR